MSPPDSRVYIIESPKPEEIIADRMEGKAIAEALKLAGHKNRYWLVKNRQELEQSLDDMTIDLGPLDSEAKVIPFFHISAHGNEHGIGLTNGDFVSWEDLRVFLWNIGEKTHRINNSAALAHITMSSCKGIYGAKMLLSPTNGAPAVSLVGPTKDISWTDSLTAWIVFYHHTLTRNAVPPSLIEVLNVASGVEKGFGFLSARDKVFTG